MDTRLNKRAYRKNMSSHGWMYLGGEMREITVKNISITGMLAELDNKYADNDSERTIKNISVSSSIDFYFPQLCLSGAAKIVRVESEQQEHILLAMAFENIAYTDAEPVFKRKSFRKNMAIPGRILLNGGYFNFLSGNLSLDGLMIHVPTPLVIEKDIIIGFELEALNLKGLAKVIWFTTPNNTETLIGLQYVKPKKSRSGGLSDAAFRASAYHLFKQSKTYKIQPDKLWIGH